MSQTNELKRDYFWNTLGVFLQNAISPVLLVVVARVNGVNDLGLFSFVFSISLVFFSIAIWGGRTYQVSDVRHEFRGQSYVATRIVLGIAVALAAGLFCFINQYDATKTTLLLILVFFKVFESISDALYGVMQTHKHLYNSGMSLTLKAVGGVGAFLITDMVTRDLLLASLSLVIVNVVVLLTYDRGKVERLDPGILLPGTFWQSYRDSWQIMRRTSPVFIISFLSVLALSIPRYFIDIYHPDQNGHFGVMTMPITLVLLVMTFAMQPNIVGLAQHYNGRNFAQFQKTIMTIIKVTTLLGVAIVGMTYALGVPILNLIFAIDFSSYRVELIVIIIAGVINAFVSIMINTLTIMRKFREQVLLLLLGDGLLLLIAPFAVKDNGMGAAIFLYTGISLLQAVLLYVVYRRTLKEKLNE